MNTQANPKSFIAAVATILMAVLLYNIMGAIVKHLIQFYPSQQLSMFRNLFGLIPTVIILFYSSNWIKAGRPLAIRQWKLALFRGGLGALAQLAFYFSLSHLEFAAATTIALSGPLIITALSIPVLGQRVGFWRWLAVLIGFAGVLLVMRPTTQSFNWYSVLPFCAALGYASTSVTSKLFDNSVPTPVINLYYSIGSLFGATLLVIVSGGFVPVGNIEDWIWLVAMGLAGGLAAFCLITAYRLADPSSLSPFEYFGIPFSFGLGWLFFAESPFDKLIPGAFLIAGGGLLVIWREHYLKKVLQK